METKATRRARAVAITTAILTAIFVVFFLNGCTAGGTLEITSPYTGMTYRILGGTNRAIPAVEPEK